MSQLNWTEAQWNRVNSAITEEFTKASVAGACLPCYGPVGASMEAVSKQQLKPNTGNPSIIKVSDKETTPFWTIRTYVHLNSQQVADENLSSALFAFKRAANMLARAEDRLVFVGNEGAHPPRPLNIPGGGGSVQISDELKNVIGNEEHFFAPGLLTAHENDDSHLPVAPRQIIKGNETLTHYGEELVTKIATAIGLLEKAGYPGPFTCVLGQNAFIEAHRPNPGSLVLPADRITPMLGGPLLRSGSMLDNYGVVASSCGESLDIVVATPPKAQFLNVNDEAKYVFRVYERFVLRIKDPNAVVSIGLS